MILKIRKNSLFLVIIYFLFYISRLNATYNFYLPYTPSGIVDGAKSIFFNPSALALNRKFNLFFNISYQNNTRTSIAISFDTLLGGFAYEDFLASNKSISIYNFVIPFSFTLAHYTFYAGFKNTLFNIDDRKFYTYGLSFLYRINYLSFSVVMDNMYQQKIPELSLDTIDKKIGIAFSLFNHRLLLSIENYCRKDLLIENNVYSLFLEPLNGVKLYANYFNLQWSRKWQMGLEFRLPHGGGGYSTEKGKGIPLKNQIFQLTLQKDAYPSKLTIPDQVAVIEIGGPLEDFETLSLFGNFKEGTQNIINDIDKCIKDSNITGILLIIRPVSSTTYAGVGGFIYEIRRKLFEFRKRGGYVVAYLVDGGSSSEYYLATAANKIVMSPYSALYSMGLNVNIIKLIGLLKKIGIEFELVQAGKEKNIYNSLAGEVPEEAKQRLKESLRTLYKYYIKEISQSRAVPASKVEEIFNSSPVISPQVLKENHLIDSIGYKEKAKEVLAYLMNDKSIGPWRIINIKEKTYYKRDWRVYPKIAVVPIYGDIVSGRTVYNPLNGTIVTGADTVVDQLEKIRKDPFVKGVILRIDSPGGVMSASDEIYNAVLKLKNSGKYVVASIGSIGTSGAYYVACSADKIVAPPYAITGHIGVFLMKLSIPELMEKFNINSYSFKEGEFADTFSITRKFSPLERKKLNENIRHLYNRFIDVVAKSRKISREKLKKLAEGKIYNGLDAKEKNLIDQLGGFSDAIEIIKKEKDIKNPVIIYYWQDKWYLAPVEFLGSNLLYKKFENIFEK